MINATMATYPPREGTLASVLEGIAPQVDALKLVLNEYAEIPKVLKKFTNVHPIIPDHDTKDAGKFLPKAEGKYTLFLDDDLFYPQDYVSKTVANFERLDLAKVIAGYHGSIYYFPKFRPNLPALKRLLRFRRQRIAEYRKVHVFFEELQKFTVVDQIASGCTIMLSDLVPPYEYMRDSQKFVDVRLGKWCFENGILPVSLPREKAWIKPIEFEETIYQEFTRINPSHVADEIWTYAFKTPGRGSSPPLKPV